MRWSTLSARLRRPATVTACVAVIATAFMPLDGPISQATVMQRVIATPVEIPVFIPTSLVIPKIGVDNPVMAVYTDGDGRMGSPTGATNVGWWAGRKAGLGNVLLDGHHDWNGEVGSFYRLGELKPGDKIIVKGSDPTKVLTYRVIWLKNFDREVDATELLGNRGKKQIATLITCGGTFDTIAHTHRERVVARAELVSA